MNTTLLQRHDPDISAVFNHSSPDKLKIDLLPMTPMENAIHAIPTAGDGNSPVDLNRLLPGKYRPSPSGPYSQNQLQDIARNLFLPSSGLKRELTSAIRRIIYG